MKKTKDTLSESMNVLKTATCKTLSGKSTLTYQIGRRPDSSIHLRISKNDGGGFFSDEWIGFEAIQQALKKKRPEGSAITSFFLAPLFKGKSVNTPSFLMAALKQLKLIQPLKGKQRQHEPMDPRPFLDQVDQLTSSSSEKAKAPTRRPAKKSAKKKTTTRKAPTSK